MAQDLTIAYEYIAKGAAGSLAPLADPALSMGKEGALDIRYAPFDHVVPNAELVIVGITPGLTQADNAWAAVRGALQRGLSVDEALKIAKLTGSFSGPLRSNLVSLLDDIGVHRLLKVSSSAQVFAPGSERVHFTSALRYPVFVDGQNYNGNPDMLRTPILRRMLEIHLAEEARLLPRAIWLPLGPKADAAVQLMADLGHLDRRQILSGLPHPSGANAERVAVFTGRKDPAKASRQTNAAALLEARERLRKQVLELGGVSA